MKKILASIVLCFLFSINGKAQTGVGIGTVTPKALLNVAENGTVLFGNDTTGAGAKLMWIPSKSAFRAGVIGPTPGSLNEDGSIWDYDSIGLYSFAIGLQNRAKNLGAVAMGGNNSTTGIYGMSIGYGNVNKGQYGFVSGFDNTVNSGAVTAVTGSNNIVSGNYNTVSGQGNVVSGNNAFVSGHGDTVNASFGFTLGNDCENNGVMSFLSGYRNRMNGSYAASMGEGNVINFSRCFVFGSYNDSIAEKNNNIPYLASPLFIVGNGTGESARKNAMVILKNGYTGFGVNDPTAPVHIRADGSTGYPQLRLEEKSTTDYSRISFENENPGFWEVAGYSQPLLASVSAAQFNFYFSRSGINVLSLKGNGNAVLDGTLTQSSDERLKKNIFPLKNVLSKLAALNGYTYQWKDSSKGTEEQIGFIAQEVEKQFPQLVQTNDKGMKSVAYANMGPVLLEAIREQQVQIDELKKMINTRK